jgi:hypothetical protein
MGTNKGVVMREHGLKIVKKTLKSRATVTREAALKRVRPPRKVLDAAVSRFEKSVTAALESDLSSITNNARHLENVTAPLGVLIGNDRRAIASMKALYKIADDAHTRRVDAIRKGIVEEPATTFNFTADPGWQMLAPPYDVSWGTGAAFGDKFDGKLLALIGDGFAAAGVGVFLSVTKRSLVRFRPIAPYGYDWGNFAFRGPASSRGGVGMLGYINNSSQPFLDRRGSLWTDTQVPGNTGNGSGSGQLADRLWSDVMLMDPGNTYLLWTWVWGMGRMSAQEERLSLSLAQITCRVAAIVVDAGPVPVIR